MLYQMKFYMMSIHAETNSKHNWKLWTDNVIELFVKSVNVSKMLIVLIIPIVLELVFVVIV